MYNHKEENEYRSPLTLCMTRAWSFKSGGERCIEPFGQCFAVFGITYNNNALPMNLYLPFVYKNLSVRIFKDRESNYKCL